MVDERDFLTQLLDRKAFDRVLAAAVAEATQLDEPLSLVMVDIDHFKRVNDAHGHQVGDTILKGVADRLAAAVRLKGYACRYGGEELALILPNHSAAEALSVAERCRRAIEGSQVAGIQVTSSFGVACVPVHAKNPEELLRAADQAMYDAKNRGRNIDRLQGEPEPPRPGPREPERKHPEPGRLTDMQKAKMRRRILRHEHIECPYDGAHFDVIDVTSHSSVGREFLITCPDCGMSESLSGGER